MLRSHYPKQQTFDIWRELPNWHLSGNEGLSHQLSDIEHDPQEDQGEKGMLVDG